MRYKFYTPAELGFYAFNVEKCERCGVECEATNTIKLRNTRPEVEARGLRERTLPDEVICLAANGDSVCESCANADGNARVRS